MEIYIWLFVCICNFNGLVSGAGLKWVRVNVPQYRVPGETAQLQCEYDLGNDTLYSVKWYKDHEEFYRFVPKERPQSNWFEVDGIHVDMSRSDSKRVVIRPIDWKSTGIFRCEVSAEAPSFASAQSEAKMEVVALPTENPVISGVEDEYQIGDEINLNCTAGKSHPASILHWYINEQQIQKQDALISYPDEQHSRGLVSSVLGLKFKLGNHHFRGGSMRVKCVASMTPLLYESDRESVVHTKSLPLREALLLVKSFGSRNEFNIASFLFAAIYLLT
ncbi:cell adhesion molecule 2-like [Diorhabda sublineata]|uniref:cell adhesion molecule 2-like n=1 Tax=Diorhabda sublineata TaxID=1163346 RepID=UPI0024E0803F|nr:cell adhesion molecule 2-like [Diorhabda sublineata]